MIQLVVYCFTLLGQYAFDHSRSAITSLKAVEKRVLTPGIINHAACLKIMDRRFSNFHVRVTWQLLSLYPTIRISLPRLLCSLMRPMLKSL